MTKILTLVLISMICTSLPSTNAATFQCSEDAAACKTKFGTQFEKDFKEMHVNALRKFFTIYLDNIKAIRAELSENVPYSLTIDESVNGVQNSLKKLNENPNDYKKIGEAFIEGMKSMEWDIRRLPETEQFMKLMEEHNVRDKMINILRKLATDTGNLWGEMYTGLRAEDLQAYPEYEKVNKSMVLLRGDGERKASSTDFIVAAAILSTEFHLPYFEVIDSIS